MCNPFPPGDAEIGQAPLLLEALHPLFVHRALGGNKPSSQPGRETRETQPLAACRRVIQRDLGLFAVLLVAIDGETLFEATLAAFRTLSSAFDRFFEDLSRPGASGVLSFCHGRCSPTSSRFTSASSTWERRVPRHCVLDQASACSHDRAAHHQSASGQFPRAASANSWPPCRPIAPLSTQSLRALPKADALERAIRRWSLRLVAEGRAWACQPIRSKPDRHLG